MRPDVHLRDTLDRDLRGLQRIEDSRRYDEIAARNARNAQRYNTIRAWLTHTDEVRGNDPRSYQQRMAWETRDEIVAGDTLGTFVRRSYDCGEVHVEVDNHEDAWPYRVHLGEIDLGDVIFGWCEPCDLRERIHQGLTAGIGDAPGTARIIE